MREHTAERLGFIDLTRVFAMLMMVQGHTLDAVLSVDYRATTGFYVWSFLRGLTSCLFLFLSGFLFTVTTHRTWPRYTSDLSAIGRRMRRYVALLGLGYLLHFPTGRLVDLPFLTDGAWRGFLAVDILQCIAVSLCGLQLLVVATRTPRRFAMAASVACLGVVMLTPAFWRHDASEHLPLALVGYLSPHSGALFPLLPWSAYVLLGAALGQLYQQSGPDEHRFASRVLCPWALVMIATALACSRLPLEPFGRTDFWTTSPNQFLLRAGLALLLVIVIVHVSRFVSSGHVLVQSVAEATLVVYVVHVCVIYGSRWNTGLHQIHGNTMPLLPALGHVAVLWIAMAFLAITWNHSRRHCRRLTRRLSVGTAAALAVTLL